MPPAGAGREDCWSDGGTACLVDAWGDRFLRLNRGHLRQPDWSAVADAVNARQILLGRPPKTDVQCKNRIDTVKKKYKAEKSRPRGTSRWPFFPKVDALLDPAAASSSSHRKLLLPSLQRLALTMKPAVSGGSSLKSRMRSSQTTSSESSGGENHDELHDEVNGFGNGREKRKCKEPVECREGGSGDLGQLARAIMGLAEVYERVEGEKQRQAAELERRQMEFAKEVEFQRMKMFMDLQFEIQKMKVKRPKHTGKRP